MVSKDVSGIHAAAEKARKEMKGESRLYEEQHFFNFVEGVFRSTASASSKLDAIYDEYKRIKKIPW